MECVLEKKNIGHLPCAIRFREIRRLLELYTVLSIVWGCEVEKGKSSEEGSALMSEVIVEEKREQQRKPHMDPWVNSVSGS